MPFKIKYGDMTPAVRKSLMVEQNKGKPIIRKNKENKEQCPGGALCPYPDILCTECELVH